MFAYYNKLAFTVFEGEMVVEQYAVSTNGRH